MFRIKIITRNNGTQSFIPQVGFSKSIGFLKSKVVTKWENIIIVHSMYESSTTITASFPTEDQALKIIEGYKEMNSMKEGALIRTVTYKTID